mmetsp:Transcript_3594/g.8883  ORF Transcript_3594/g.8883 Transcript_3594/m.8883 type:complete len:117 (-) Transcript_3594:416-766(-)
MSVAARTSLRTLVFRERSASASPSPVNEVCQDLLWSRRGVERELGLEIAKAGGGRPVADRAGRKKASNALATLLCKPVGLDDRDAANDPWAVVCGRSFLPPLHLAQKKSPSTWPPS